LRPSREPYDELFEHQPRRHRALTLQIQIGLQQPAVKLIAAMPP
jgi:hypothetical protein